MAGQRGMKRWEIYTHPKMNISVQVFIITSERQGEKGYYHAKYGNTSFTQPTLKELQDKLKAAIELENQLNWLPIMTIKTAHPQHNKQNNNIRVDYDRFLVARKPDGRWVQTSWDTPVEKRFERSSSIASKTSDLYEDGLPAEIVDHSHWEGNQVKVYLNYDEKLWYAMEWLTKQLSTIRDMISNVLLNTSGREKLISNAHKALPLLSESDGTNG